MAYSPFSNRPLYSSGPVNDTFHQAGKLPELSPEALASIKRSKEIQTANDAWRDTEVLPAEQPKLSR